MKKWVCLLLIFISLSSTAQVAFKWDIIEKSNKSKEQLYSDTKMFIAEYWKSAQNVLQNDDKEKGLILVKGSCKENLVYQLNDHIWIYDYTVKFYMKDEKFRVVVDNVYCESARCGKYEWPLMPVADEYPNKKGLSTTGVSEKRYKVLMSSLKSDLQNIVDSYQVYIKKESSNQDNW